MTALIPLLQTQYYKRRILPAPPYTNSCGSPQYEPICKPLKILHDDGVTIERCLLSCHKTFHSVDEGIALQLKSAGNSIVRQQQIIIGFDIHQQESFWFALNIQVLVVLRDRFFLASTVVIDQCGQMLIRFCLCGSAECYIWYVETCCRQIGQLRCYRSEFVRQEQQKECPQEMVSGRLKIIMQMGQFSYSISYYIIYLL